MATLRELAGRRLAREAVWIGGGQILVALGRLVGVRLLTELLGKESFGWAGLLLAAQALAVGFVCNPLLQAVLWMFPQARAEGRISSLRRVSEGMLRPTAATLAVVAIVVGAAWTWSGRTQPGLAAFVAIAALLVVDLTRTYESGFLNASRQQVPFAAWNVADAWARPLVAAGLVALLGASASWAIAGNAIGCALVLAAFWGRRVTAPDEAGAPSSDWLGDARGRMLRFAAPLVPFAVLGWVVGTSDRFVVASLSTVEEAGLYIAAYGLASAPFLALTSVGVLTFRPALFEAAAAGDRARERRIVAGWAASFGFVGVLGATAAGLLAPWLVSIALAKEFASAASLVAWIAAAYAVQGVQIVFETRLFAHGRTRSLLALQIVGAAASLAGFVAWIPRLGAAGAARAVLASMIASCLAAAWLASRAGQDAGGRSSGNGEPSGAERS